MKKLFGFLMMLLLLALGLVALKNTDFTKIMSEISKQKIYIQRDSEINFLPDWTVDEVFEKLNIARTDAGLSPLIQNSKLDQSAKARLAVILAEEDYDGRVTGLSIDKSLVVSGYDGSLVGDLYLLGFFKSNDPVAYWNNQKDSWSTLNHPDFKDVGMAIKNSEDKVEIYILLAAPKKIIKQTKPAKVVWGGIELWEAVNKRRVELGVNSLSQKSELCTIASIRLNQLLELGKLDGHSGFVPVLERDDLKWITEKYNISEFLIQGFASPEDSVKAWENTLGHKALLSGGEYVWGCVYAQNTFGVAIAAY